MKKSELRKMIKEELLREATPISIQQGRNSEKEWKQLKVDAWKIYSANKVKIEKLMAKEWGVLRKKYKNFNESEVSDAVDEVIDDHTIEPSEAWQILLPPWGW